MTPRPVNYDNVHINITKHGSFRIDLWKEKKQYDVSWNKYEN